MHAGDTGRTSKKRHTPLQVSPSQHHSRWNYSPQHWETINLIFKLSALKDKLWTPRLPGWTPAQHPWCQASPAQPHPPQLQSEPGLPGDPHLAGTSPAGHCCKRQSVGHSSLLQQQKLCPEKGGAVFCVPASSVRRPCAPVLEEQPPPAVGQLGGSPAMPAGMSSGPRPDPQQHERRDEMMCYSHNQALGQSFLAFPPVNVQVVTILFTALFWDGSRGNFLWLLKQDKKKKQTQTKPKHQQTTTNSYPIQPLPEQCSFKKWGLLINESLLFFLINI